MNIRRQKWDEGREKVDNMLDGLEARIKRVYRGAYKEIADKTSKYLSQFEKADAEHKVLVKNGKLSEKEYTKWRQSAMMTGTRYTELQDSVAYDLAKAHKEAEKLISDTTKDVLAESHNYAAYDIERQGKIQGSFSIYNRKSVEQLLARDNGIVRQPGRRVSAEIAAGRRERWDKKQVQSALAQSIVQGESIPNIAKRLAKTVGETDMKAAVRNARTMTTSAESAGRDEAFREAEEEGIQLKRRWVATLDERTRLEHRLLDGQERGVDEDFEVDGYKIYEPGDPSADPEMVYNCRCSVVAVVLDVGDIPRASKLGDMSYDEWKYGREEQANEKATEPEPAPTPAHEVVQGKDITDTWERRPDEFAFEIQDVINAQGFDGVPAIADEDEFNKAVEESGFVAQRTYAAPDQETLDAYRDQLYKGEWYVDCSTGGAQYGQGMYCAADYNGQITDGMKEEMAHYQQLGSARNGGKTINDVSEETQKQWIDESIKKHLGEEAVENKDLRTLIEFEVIPGSHNWSDVSKAIEGLGGYDKVPDITDTLVELRTRTTESCSYVETLTLTPDAKIITYNDLFDMKSSLTPASIFEEELSQGNYSEIEKLIARREFARDLTHEELTAVRQYEKEVGADKYDTTVSQFFAMASNAQARYDEYSRMDIGAYAALKGYDAIDARGHGASGSYTVILNRTKVIFRRYK